MNRAYLYRQRGKKIDPEKARSTRPWSSPSYRAGPISRTTNIELESPTSSTRSRPKQGSSARPPERELSVARPCRQHAHYSPPREKRSPIPLFHAASKEARTRFREAFEAFLDAYRIASGKLRDGYRDVAFPEGSFPPGLPFVPAVRAGPATTSPTSTLSKESGPADSHATGRGVFRGPKSGLLEASNGLKSGRQGEKGVSRAISRPCDESATEKRSFTRAQAKGSPSIGWDLFDGWDLFAFDRA